MHNSRIDTIVAIATPVGRGGIGILRISGKLVPNIACRILSKIPDPRKAEYLPFLDKNGSVLDRVIAIFFPEPRSFTGEHVLEIHGHGGQMILNLLLNNVLEISSGVRLANPGEFTERAFLNKKIDLIQAEAVADIIDATSYQAAKSASNSLQGMFSIKIHEALKQIADLRLHIESSIDFSDQNINSTSCDTIQALLETVIKNIKQIFQSALCGLLLKEGIKIVIAGNPNVGKSSLFNALMEIDRSIVSKIPGTTRDTICENIQLNDMTYCITDTAGFQENSKNEVELMGIQRTWDELKKSDHILWVIDSNDVKNKIRHSYIKDIQNTCNMINKDIPITIIRNKADLSLERIGISTIQGYTCITVSALLNSGIDLLKKHLYNVIQIQSNNVYSESIGENQGIFIARKRHIDILKQTSLYLLSAQSQLNTSITINDCFADDMRLAHQELSKIFGKYTSDDLLENIFSKFCIGK